MNWDARKARVRALESLAVMASYFVTGVAGHAIPSTHGHASPLWPAAGIAFAAFLVRGRYLWVGVAAGSFLVNFFGHTSLWAAVGLTAGNTLGPAVAAALWARKPVKAIQRLGDVLHLVCYGGLGSSISAVTGPAVLVANGSLSRNSWPSTGLMWWLGDMLGVLLIVPLVVNFADFRLSKRRLAELALLMACLVTGWELLFRSGAVTGAVFSLAILPFIIWGAVRFSIAGAALSSCMVSAVALWESARGVGPFIGYSSWLHRVEAVQMFIAVLSVSGLCLAAVIAERTTVEVALAREEKLRRAQEQYRRIVETTNDGVWLMDRDFRTSFVNRRMAEMLECTQEEMLGRSLFDFLFPEDLPQKQADLERRKRGLRDVFYNRCRRKDGSELWALVSANPFFDDSGEFSGVLAMLSDVTQLRKAEETLRRNEKLITASRLAATIAHEINNPLAVLTNVLFLMRTDNNPDYLNMAEEQLARINHIARQTLGFYRNDPNPARLNLTDVIAGVVAAFRGKVQSRGVEIETLYRSKAEIDGYANELGQVFGNLIGNALDAMSSGGKLRIRTGSYRHGLRATIADNGRGIDRENLGKVFQPFFTANKDVGTGLGLWLTREIVRKHGGTIRVRSSTHAQRHGTVFMIWLPANTPRASTAAAQ
jgi:PAS domain S-box-containing protein